MREETAATRGGGGARNMRGSSRNPLRATAGQANGRRRGPAPAEEDAYQLIAQAIINKRIRPGARLKEAALAGQFGISRARVHRVLLRLAELDVVEFRLNFGAFVSRPSPEEARAAFRTRRVLEAEAVRALIARNDRRAFRRMRAVVAEEEKAFRRRQSGVSVLSSRFHIVLGEMCGNTVLARILTQLVHRCVLIQALYERLNQETICLVEEHRKLIGLMERGHTKDALGAMERHFDHVEDSLDYGQGNTMDERLAKAIG